MSTTPGREARLARLLDDLPPAPADAQPVILPGFLSGLGITRRPAPAWITDPDLIESITTGLVDIPDDLH